MARRWSRTPTAQHARQGFQLVQGILGPGDRVNKSYIVRRGHLYRVFDSQEEVENSSEEEEFNYSTAVEVDGLGTQAMMHLGSI